MQPLIGVCCANKTNNFCNKLPTNNCFAASRHLKQPLEQLFVSKNFLQAIFAEIAINEQS
jgi:hypothetical protein